MQLVGSHAKILHLTVTERPNMMANLPAWGWIETWAACQKLTPSYTSGVQWKALSEDAWHLVQSESVHSAISNCIAFLGKGCHKTNVGGRHLIQYVSDWQHVCTVAMG